MIFILLKGVVWVNLNVFNLFTTIGYLLFKKKTPMFTIMNSTIMNSP